MISTGTGAGIGTEDTDTVLGKLGPGQLGPGQLGPGQSGPGQTLGGNNVHIC